MIIITTRCFYYYRSFCCLQYAKDLSAVVALPEDCQNPGVDGRSFLITIIAKNNLLLRCFFKWENTTKKIIKEENKQKTDTYLLHQVWLFYSRSISAEDLWIQFLSCLLSLSFFVCSFDLFSGQVLLRSSSSACCSDRCQKQQNGKKTITNIIVCCYILRKY